MAYIEIYGYEDVRLKFDNQNIDRFLENCKKHLTKEKQEQLKDILDDLYNKEINIEAYISEAYVSSNAIAEAFDEYCDENDKDDIYEEGYQKGFNDGFNSLHRNMKIFKIDNWKILSKLEKYAYFNEENKITKDDAKNILEILNNI